MCLTNECNAYYFSQGFGGSVPYQAFRTSLEGFSLLLRKELTFNRYFDFVNTENYVYNKLLFIFFEYKTHNSNYDLN